MSDHLSRLDLSTTAQLIKQSSSSFISNFYTFLFLSLLLFSFRTTVEKGTFFVTSFIDRDPSLKTLLSHLDLSGNNLKSQETLRSQAIGHRRRRPFLHLSRVGTLDEDFFSGEEDDDRRLFGFGGKLPVNGSSFNLSNFNRDAGKSGFIRSGFQFKTEGLSDVKDTVEGSESHVFIKGLELSRQDAALLVFMVSFLSAVYGWVILGFIIVNSCILGIVFCTVVNCHLGKYSSFVRSIWAGSRLGVQRLTGFILMRWAVRDAMTQIIGICFFGEIEDQHSFFRLFVRLKLMPFSVTSPWIRGYDSEIASFLIIWTLSDTFIALVFAVDSWVAIMDARRGREIVKEGFYLLSTMLTQAILLKGCEAIFCGSLVRWVLTWVFGNLFASVILSVVEVYFMVVWLIYFFAAKCKDANRDGRQFGISDLEDYINGLR
ncbi:hypothetical protein ACHQM5_010055 [Ranunculus cassubicifolius]